MKMSHITIHVTDLEKSIKFYEDILNIKVIGDLRETGMPIVFLAEEQDDVKVELIEDKDNAYKTTNISAGFITKDLDISYEKIKSMGYTVTGIISPNPNVRFFFVTDPDGFQVQIC